MTVRVGVLTLTAVLAAACQPAPGPAQTATYHGNGVTVTITVAHTERGGRDLQATFTPDTAGFHLYSKDLPTEGVDGLGTPTSVTIRGGLRATAAAAANRPVRPLRITGLDQTLPVYPDGPVTLTIPVEQTGTGPTDVDVTYGACSQDQCLPPVIAQHIALPSG